MKYYFVLTMILLSGLLLISAGHANEDQTVTSGMGNNKQFTISIEPPQDHVVGEYFTIRGATNLPLDDDIQIEIFSVSFGNANPGGPEFVNTSHEKWRTRVVSDAKGDHVWSFDINTISLKPDEYLIKVYSLRYGDGIHNVTADALFNLKPGESTLIIDIITPQENEFFLSDVVPHHIRVTGEVKSPVPLQSIIVSSSEGSTNCGNQSSFCCDVVVPKGLDRIVVSVTDRDGNRVFRTRNIKVETGIPDLPPRITISGKITTPDGRPVEGATVRTEFSRPYDTKSVAVQSEADGSYRINNAYGYNQKISVKKEGYVNVTKEMVFNENLNTADFTLEPITKPVSGFTVILCLGAITGIVLMTIYRSLSRKRREQK